MGIRGLRTFVAQRNYMTDYQFHDCRVVIDGNNLMNFIYDPAEVNHQYAGDYDTYAIQIHSFFNCLGKCQILPYVVFDSCNDGGDRKLQTVLSRAQGRIDDAIRVSLGSTETRVLPILCHVTFIQVLNEIGIEHVTCNGEADAQIAALANHWKCPVMSNDSDFFIFDLEAGVIIIDYINFQVKKAIDSHMNCYDYLSVQRYTLDGLSKDGMDKDMFPLFATMMGNDYVESIEVFGEFFTNVSLSRKGSKPKMGDLLNWLKSKKTLKNALDNVLIHFSKKKQDQKRRLVAESMAFYTDLRSTLHQYFDGSKSDRYVVAPSPTSYEGKPVPRRFVEAINMGQMPRLVVSALMLNRNNLKAQVETTSRPSSYQCAVYLRQVLYGMLLSKDNNVEEYDRVGTHLNKNLVPPVFEIHRGWKVPNLFDIGGMGTRGGEFLCHVLMTSPSTIVCLPRDLQGVMPVVVYWNKTAQPNILQLYSLLVCVLNLTGVQLAASGEAIHDHCSEVTDAAQNTKECCSLSQQIIMECSMVEIRTACDSLAQFMVCPKHNTLDDAIVHAFAQLQACLQATLAMCALLRFPLGPISPAKIINGTFMYNLYQKLISQENPVGYICELLGTTSAMSKLFRKLLEFVLDETDARG